MLTRLPRPLYRFPIEALYHRPSEGSALSMGPGAFVAALEAASHRDASTTTVCGKPSQAFLQECIGGMIPANDAMSNYTNIIVSSLCSRSNTGFDASISSSHTQSLLS